MARPTERNELEKHLPKGCKLVRVLGEGIVTDLLDNGIRVLVGDSPTMFFSKAYFLGEETRPEVGSKVAYAVYSNGRTNSREVFALG